MKATITKTDNGCVAYGCPIHHDHIEWAEQHEGEMVDIELKTYQDLSNIIDFEGSEGYPIYGDKQYAIPEIDLWDEALKSYEYGDRQWVNPKSFIEHLKQHYTLLKTNSMNNEIPKEFLDKMLGKADEIYTYREFKTAYLRGCKAAYLEHQKEIERLKGLIEELYRSNMTEFLENRQETYGTSVEELWNGYKKHHNL